MLGSIGQSQDHGHSTRRAHGLLICGAVLGIGLAAIGVLRRPPGPGSVPPPQARRQQDLEPLPSGVVARVNGLLISEEDFRQLLALEVAAGKVPDVVLKRKLVERMIDEELRVQRAIELKLHLTDPRVRMDLSSAIADAAMSGVEQEAQDRAILRSYFDSRRDYFARRGRLHVRQISVGAVAGNIGEAYSRARAAAKLLGEKERFEIVRKVCGGSDLQPIPDRLLRPDELAKHIDGIVLNTALLMQPGDVSDPIRTVDGFRVLQLIDRQNQKAATFEDSILDVEAEYWSERSRRALEADTVRLRGAALIQAAEMR